MTEIEEIEAFDHEDAAQPPQWIAAILAREDRDRQADDMRRDHEGVRRVLAIDERLVELGIEPIKPPEWSPSANELRNAVLLEPGQASSEYRIEAGWEGGPHGHVALYVYDYETCERRYAGPLETLEQAAAARFEAPGEPPGAVDHAAVAARQLYSAESAPGDDLGAFEGALLAATCAQARATLALEQTLRRIGAPSQLAHIAAHDANTAAAGDA